MNTSVSPRYFTLLYCSFFTFMVFMLHRSSWYTFFIGWEMMGVFSFLLISWFSGRCLAGNGASLAFLSNRFRDLLLFGGLLNGCGLFLLMCAGLTKSAIWLFSSWLPNAMEGPTPVSTLLHSSTMVVARVFLIGIFNYSSVLLCGVFLLYGCYMGGSGSQFSDYKRVIAYSTSSQLSLVRLICMLGSESQSLSYVEIHAFFKSLLFMLCGWLIHSNYIQHVISGYNYYFLRSGVFWCCGFMCRLPFFSVARVKDMMLIGTISLCFYFIFLIYAYRTFNYSLLLRNPVSGSPLGFLEAGHILIVYVVYVLMSIYVCELPLLGKDLRGTRVLALLLLPVFLSLISGQLSYSVDLFYKIKRSAVRSYIFSSIFQSGQILKDWAILIFFLFLCF